MKNIFLAILFLSLSSPVFSFNLFGPKSYEQCVRKGLKDAGSDTELRLLIRMCKKEFSDDTKNTDGFDADLKACGMTEPYNDYWLPYNHASTKKIIKNLSAKDLSDGNSSGRLLYFKFQNRNEFDIEEVRLGFMDDGQTCAQYQVAIDFLATQKVRAGTFGEVIHIDQAWLVNKYKRYCVLSVKPERDEWPLDKAKLFIFMKQHGYCK